jgi:hypothetical protein
MRVTQTEMLANPKKMAQFTPEQLSRWAEKNGIPTVGDGDANLIHGRDGQLVLYNGKLLRVEKTNTTLDRSGFYNYRRYTGNLVDPATGELVKGFNEKKKASKW